MSTAPDPAPVALAALSPREFALWHDGYAAGLDHGHRAEEDREDRLYEHLAQRAARIVHAHADLPTHDEMEEQRRRAERPAWLPADEPWPFLGRAGRGVAPVSDTDARSGFQADARNPRTAA